MLEKKELEKTDIFKLCSTFDKNEMAKCLIFLNEFTNASKKCRILFEEILKCYKKNKYKWHAINLTVSSLNKKLFGKEEDSTTARVLRSELYKNLKKYCIFIDSNRQQQNLNDISFLGYLANRKVDDLFFKEYNRIDKKQESKIGTDYTYIQYQSYLSYIELILKDQSKKNKLNYNLHYQNFSHYSIVQKIQNYCFILNHHLIEKQEIHPEIEKEAALLFHQAKQIPNIKTIAEIYETASLMLKNDKSAYLKLKELIINVESSISKKDKQHLYLLMYNFCVRCNDPKLLNESRLNHIKLFDEGLLHNGEYIILMTAKSLCTAVLALTRSSDESSKMSKDEAEEKIKIIIQELPSKHRQSTENFHLAVLDFYFGDYINAIKKLKSSPKYANVFFNFDARVILQRCYYFTEDIDEFDNGIKSFQAALRNDQDLSEKHKKEYLNFTSAINILQKANNVIDKMEKEKLLQKLEKFLQEHPVKVLAWFRIQIELLR